MVQVGEALPFHNARDAVNLHAIRRWGDAVGDRNPVHTDPAVAERSRFGHVVAPLAMFDVWTKPGLAYVRDVSDPQGAAFESLDAEGFTSAVAVGSELVQDRPLTLGETVTSTIMLESISPPKTTALGAGRFVTTLQQFSVGGSAIGHARFTVLKFRPPDQAAGTPTGQAAAPSPPSPPSPPEPSDDVPRDDLGTVVARGLEPGRPAPPATIPVTTTLIVAGALMTSDYFDAHHDRDAAVRRGSRDVFMNIHTTLGLIEACVGNWTGPNAVWRSMHVRLGVPNYPGDTMVVDGAVSAVDETDGETTITFRAINSLGTHAAGSIGLTLPT